MLQSSALTPVPILGTAYNQEASVVENVRSMLTLNYPSYEIVVINDGIELLLCMRRMMRNKNLTQ